MIHILKHGLSLCQTFLDVPAKWPPGHLWVSFESEDDITKYASCDDCLKLVEPARSVLFCPKCGKQHLDVGEFATRVHRTHLCENTPEGPKTGCGHLWRPKKTPTFGVDSASVKV
jgi:hypothetical protein